VTQRQGLVDLVRIDRFATPGLHQLHATSELLIAQHTVIAELTDPLIDPVRNSGRHLASLLIAKFKRVLGGFLPDEGGRRPRPDHPGLKRATKESDQIRSFTGARDRKKTSCFPPNTAPEVLPDIAGAGGVIRQAGSGQECA